MTDDTESQLLTEAEVVRRYRGALSAGTLRNWRSQGVGPAYLRIGRAILYSREDLERWEATRRKLNGHGKQTVSERETGSAAEE